ncbi:baseplate J/gp47 family protein [Paenibacillus odorifer]|uniref:baseplate J/gp47 family protein n=1 Tax=Paenibacillus odorifer TaxID=189426 RepID=UPI00349FCD6C
MAVYENQTFETILERMLDRVPDGLDKREGSIIYDAMAPAAMELAQMYVELDINANLIFADTASGDYLDRSIAWSGVTRKKATKAQLRGLFYNASNTLMDIPVGSRFAIGAINYKVISRLSLGEYRLEAEVEGVTGNQHFGALIPIDFINNLARAELTELLIPGSDRETDDALRQRYLDSARRPATSGNKYHYIEWALEVSGVGGARVFPLWSGPKTVKVVIVNTEGAPASSVLVNQVQDYIDPAAGKGEGQAPIGAVVTVTSAIGKTINISAKVTLAPGYTLQGVKNSFLERLETWRKSASFVSTYVSQAVIGSILLGTDGVIDYLGLLLNGAAGNIVLAEEEVPLIGIVELGV